MNSSFFNPLTSGQLLKRGWNNNMLSALVTSETFTAYEGDGTCLDLINWDITTPISVLQCICTVSNMLIRVRPISVSFETNNKKLPWGLANRASIPVPLRQRTGGPNTCPRCTSAGVSTADVHIIHLSLRGIHTRPTCTLEQMRFSCQYRTSTRPRRVVTGAT